MVSEVVFKSAVLTFLVCEFPTSPVTISSWVCSKMENLIIPNALLQVELRPNGNASKLESIKRSVYMLDLTLSEILISFCKNDTK